MLYETRESLYRFAISQTFFRKMLSNNKNKNSKKATWINNGLLFTFFKIYREIQYEICFKKPHNCLNFLLHQNNLLYTKNSVFAIPFLML